MNTEDAYRSIAAAIVDTVGGSDWEVASSTTQILARTTRTSYRRVEKNGCVVENDRFPYFDVAGEASEAFIFLRDNLLHTTGSRIWGVVFTLYSTGKFNIEYDYSKPEGYEESDDVITGNEINALLSNLGEV